MYKRQLEYYAPEGSKLARWLPVITGGVLAALTALVIFGGVHRIGTITSGLVPVMALIYICLLYTSRCV